MLSWKKCEDCGRSFKNERGLNKHRSAAHPSAIVPPKESPPGRDPLTPINEFEGTEPLGRLGMLKLDAEQLADGLGHALNSWRNHDRWADTYCVLCSRETAVAEHPPTGKPFVSGAAIAEACSAKKV